MRAIQRRLKRLYNFIPQTIEIAWASSLVSNDLSMLNIKWKSLPPSLVAYKNPFLASRYGVAELEPNIWIIFADVSQTCRGIPDTIFNLRNGNDDLILPHRAGSSLSLVDHAARRKRRRS